MDWVDGHKMDDKRDFARLIHLDLVCLPAVECRPPVTRALFDDGMLPEAGDVERLTALLGRPLRTYRDFALETVASA